MGQWNTQVPESTRGCIQSRIQRCLHVEINDQDLTMEAKVAEEGEEDEEEPSQEPQGISIGSHDSLEEDRNSVDTQMQQSFHVLLR